MKILFCILLFFQSKNITVVDFETNKPIPFASFIGLNDRKGGYTDENGVIVLSENTNQRYVISCVGFASDTVNFEEKTIKLKPLANVLSTVVIAAKKIDLQNMELGYFKKYSWFSFGAQAKYEFYTFISNPDTSINWQIKSIKIAVSGHRKKKFDFFKIRPLLKDVLERRPNNDLLIDNVTVNVPKGQNSVIIELPTPIFLPKEGCFVGFETIGFSINSGEFIPFSDFAKMPNDENVAISIPLVKTNSRSLWRIKNGKGWYGSPSDTHNAFAFGLDVLY